jgi:hypothetical protein
MYVLGGGVAGDMVLKDLPGKGGEPYWKRPGHDLWHVRRR